MRTTINLPDSLLAQAKKAAVDADTTLTDFVADAIRLTLAQKKRRSLEDVPPMPTFRPPPGEEGWQPGVDLDDTSALLDLMDEPDAADRR
jgi:hypothetical protein